MLHIHGYLLVLFPVFGIGGSFYFALTTRSVVNSVVRNDHSLRMYEVNRRKGSVGTRSSLKVCRKIAGVKRSVTSWIVDPSHHLSQLVVVVDPKAPLPASFQYRMTKLPRFQRMVASLTGMEFKNGNADLALHPESWPPIIKTVSKTKGLFDSSDGSTPQYHRHHPGVFPRRGDRLIGIGILNLLDVNPLEPRQLGRPGNILTVRRESEERRQLADANAKTITIRYVLRRLLLLYASTLQPFEVTFSRSSVSESSATAATATHPFPTSHKRGSSGAHRPPQKKRPRLQKRPRSQPTSESASVEAARASHRDTSGLSVVGNPAASELERSKSNSAGAGVHEECDFD